jgi:glucuronoarabinoxylan endo-1,4-beta-xylanase
MYQRIAFCLVLLAYLSVDAQTSANVRGKVTNLAGKGIANATVTLVRQGMYATTGADGTYSITGPLVAVLPDIFPQSERITLKKGVLDLALNNPAPVKIEIFDVKGNLLRKEMVGNVVAGKYRMDILKGIQATNLLVINASVGKRVMTFRYLPLKGATYTVNPTAAPSSAGGLTKMAAAVIDTVKTTASKYLTKSTTITSYDVELNITLDTLPSGLTVQLDQPRQTIEGWGINNNWKELGGDINACFDSATGLGLNILRVGMNENGGVATGAGDISAARNKGAKIIGSTWSPPGSYKTSGTVNDGGHIKSANYDQWATTIANFAKSNNLYAMSLGNEPDFKSCGMSEPCNGNYPTTEFYADEVVAFIKVLGPKMRSTAPNCKIMAPEASEWIHTWSDTSGCCSTPGNKPSSDPFKCGCFTGKTTACGCAAGKGYSYGKYLYEDKAAWAYVDILGVHQYDTQKSEPWPAYVKVEDRKPVWQTEMSGVKWWPDGSPSTDIKNGVVVAGWIHDALTVGEMNAWCYWWYKGGSDTNEGLYLGSTDTKRHYTFGNFTKYVRPGMVRVMTTGSISNDVLITAFKGTGTKVVIVAINKGSSAATVPITITGGTAPTAMTPIVTSSSENWASKTDLPVTSGTFTASLAATTVTTFVSK